MALWYIGASGPGAGPETLKPDTLRQARLALGAGTPILVSDGLCASLRSGLDTNELHRASLEIKARNQMAFEGSVTHEGRTRFFVRIDVLQRRGAQSPTATIRHRGRAVQPQDAAVRISLEHYSRAIEHLFAWLSTLVANGRLDYRAQSPKLRLDEEKRWGHPFPLAGSELQIFRDAMLQEMAKMPGLLQQEWADKCASVRSKSEAASVRLQIMNALPDGAPIASVDGDRLYGAQKISIGRKTGAFGSDTARRSRLLGDDDLGLIIASDDFPLSKHDQLHLFQEVSRLRAQHPEACRFDLPFHDLKAEPDIRLARAPCLPSFYGKAHPSPSSASGIRDYSWVRTGPDGGQCKEFAPADAACAWQGTPADAAQHNLKGWGLPSHMPHALQHRPRPSSGPLRLQDIICVAGFWIVSDRCRRILQHHNLGRTTFQPVVLQDRSGSPLEADQWYYLSFGESRRLFAKEQSPHALAYGRRKAPPYKLSVYEHDQVFLKPAAGDVDLWVDQDIEDAFFLSGRLALALKNAKLNLRLGLRRCLPAS